MASKRSDGMENTMNKSDYYFGIFMTGLYVVITLFQSVIYLRIGPAVYTLGSFLPMFVLVNSINLLVVLILLKYYRCKKYRYSFWSGLASFLSSLFLGYVFYNMLAERQPDDYYFPAHFIFLGLGILSSLMLIFSNAGERLWLKTAGIVSLTHGIAFTALLICFLRTKDVLLQQTLEIFARWITLAVSLVPLLFVLNFRQELRALREENRQPGRSQDTVLTIMGLVTTVVLIAAVMLGFRMSHEMLPFTGYISDRARTLAQPFESRAYVNGRGETMQYRFLQPLHFDPKKKYPLVVCLPYTCGDDNIRQVEACPPAQLLLQPENREKYPAFLFVPRCPEGTGWGGVPNRPSVEALALETIAALIKEPAIDEKRVYVTGVSRGGYGSWHFIGIRPQMFAAAMPVCGADDPRLGRNMADVPVWAFHGEQDKNVPVSGSRNLIAAIRKAGGSPRYTEFQGAGHDIWKQVADTPGALDWLFKQKRD